MDWAQSLLIMKHGGRICADSRMEEDPVSAIGGGVGRGGCSLVEMQLLGGCSTRGLLSVVWVVAIFRNVEDKLCYGNLCICSWASYRMERNLLCVFRKSVKLYLSQQAGYPLPPLSLCPVPGLSGSDKNDIILYQAVS